MGNELRRRISDSLIPFIRAFNFAIFLFLCIPPIGTKVYSLFPSVPGDPGSLQRLSSQDLSKLSTLKEMKEKDVTKVTYPVTNVLSILLVEQLVLQELKEGFKGGFL